jgi:hypothetical protein
MLSLFAPLTLLIAWGGPGPGVRDVGTSSPARTSRDEIKRLHEAAGRVRRATFFVGQPGRGQATAFLISREERLLATAAHVADHAASGEVTLAVPDGTASTYRVVRIWYHPGIVRKLDDGLYARSDDPRDGPIGYRVPDVAVLQLAAGGADLPGACELASDKELHDLDGRTIGLLGYPGAVEHRWPTPDRPAAARLATGVVSRTTGPSEDVSAPPGRRQWVWHTAQLGGGSSGGPLFLANGHVAAIHSMGGKSEDGAPDLDGYRIDCLRELLAYHSLGGVALENVRKGASRRGWGPDPRLPQLRRAVQLVREGEALRRRGHYAAAGRRCNEALRLAPDYAGALLLRSKVYLYYCGANWKKLDAEERRRFAAWASDDSRRCIELLPQWTEPYLIEAQNNVYLGVAFPAEDHFARNLAFIDDVLSWAPLEDSGRAFLLNCRAQSRCFLGDLDRAEGDYDESIRLAPEEPRWRLNRAQYWKQRGRPERAAEDLRQAQSVRQRRDR